MVCARAVAVWGVPLVVVEDREDTDVACGFDCTRTFPRASAADEYPRSNKSTDLASPRREFFTALSPQESRRLNPSLSPPVAAGQPKIQRVIGPVFRNSTTSLFFVLIRGKIPKTSLI